MADSVIGWREGVRPWRVAWLVLFVMWCNSLTGVRNAFGTVILVSIQQQQQLATRKVRRSGTAAVGDAHIEEGQLALQHVADDDVKLHCQLQPCCTLPEMK